MKNLFFEQQLHKVVCYDCDPSDNMKSDEVFRIDNGCIKSLITCLESLSDKCKETARGNIVAKMIGNTIHVTKA